MPAARDITCVFRERMASRPGEIIHVAPERAQVHLFDKETGSADWPAN